MISDAYVEVECNDCHTFETVSLTPTARNSWDERNVANRLEHLGWLIIDDEHYCEECRKDHE